MWRNRLAWAPSGKILKRQILDEAIAHLAKTASGIAAITTEPSGASGRA